MSNSGLLSGGAERGGGSVIAGTPPRQVRFPIAPAYIPGQYHIPRIPANGFNPSNSLPADKVVLTPVVAPHDCIATRIGVRIDNAGSGGVTTARLGIYSTNTLTGVPSRLLLDAGTVDATAIGTSIEIAIRYPVERGALYWIALTHGCTTAPTFRALAITAQNQYSPGFNYASFNNNLTPDWGSFQFDRTYQELPESIYAPALAKGTAPMMATWLKLEDGG